MASGGKAPKPTDPEAAASAQARWNRTGQQTPFGSVEWQGNNQVVKPSDAMMAMFGQAQGIATGGAERYQAPSNFGDIRSQVMDRLNANQYQPGSRATDSKPTEQNSLAKGTPIRDAFLGEKDPETGDRRFIRHVLRGGLMGSIPRAAMNLIEERRSNNIPGAVNLSSPGNAPIERTPFNQQGAMSPTAMPGMGRGPIDQMPVSLPRDTVPRGSTPMQPVAMPRPGNSPIEQIPVDLQLGQNLNPGRTEMTPEEVAQQVAQFDRYRNDPSSILYQGGSARDPFPTQNMGPGAHQFNSPLAALFAQHNPQTGAGEGFQSAVEAARRAMQSNPNSVR